ncbi:transposable element Tc1 transposase [Trichonephila clavipes]|nr:transposable element Tc1 transposase [Trichonephila clavipes]
MPPRRNKEKFQQLTKFERGRIIGLREGRFSHRAIGAHVQWNSSTVRRFWKQWSNEHPTTKKTSSGRRKASSIRRRLLHRARVLLYRIPLTANHRRLRLQWAHEYRAWLVFSDESRFHLWDHDGRLCVRRYAGERCLQECVFERHSGVTPGVMVWGAISYHERSTLLRIEGVTKLVTSPAPNYYGSLALADKCCENSRLFLNCWEGISELGPRRHKETHQQCVFSYPRFQ